MQFVDIRNCLARIIWPMVAAMAGMYWHCNEYLSYENAALGTSIMALFVLPSVLAFILIEIFHQKAYLKHLGFFMPVGIVVGLVIYYYFNIRQGELEMGGGDGSLDALILLTTIYSIGVTVAYAFLLLRGILTKKL